MVHTHEAHVAYYDAIDPSAAVPVICVSQSLLASGVIRNANVALIMLTNANNSDYSTVWYSVMCFGNILETAAQSQERFNLIEIASRHFSIAVYG